MHGQSLKIYNGKIITPGGIIPDGSLVIQQGVITAIAGEDLPVSPEITGIDAMGHYISPGFIDLHVHGGGGYDFMDGTAEAFRGIAAAHSRYGTTSLMPTTVSCSKQELLQMLDTYEQARSGNYKGASFEGVHLEGPYLAMSQRGAQDPEYIRDPDPTEYEDILSKSDSIKRWSAAPELKGALEFGKYISDRGIIAAVAHTDAVYDEVLQASENGYSLATHLYSGMSGVTRRNAFRYAGVIESVLLLDEFDVEIIADGIHVPPPLLKLAYKIKGPDKIALITDAMRASGMPPGESILGSGQRGLRVIVEDGVAKLPDRSSFAGSVATANQLVRNMAELAAVPLTDAVKMMTATPARILGIGDRKGSIATGKDGDIVIFDNQFDVQTTIVRGEIVYNKLHPVA